MDGVLRLSHLVFSSCIVHILTPDDSYAKSRDYHTYFTSSTWSLLTRTPLTGGTRFFAGHRRWSFPLEMKS